MGWETLYSQGIRITLLEIPGTATDTFSQKGRGTTTASEARHSRDRDWLATYNLGRSAGGILWLLYFLTQFTELGRSLCWSM